VTLYRDLLALVENKDVRLEEYARDMIRAEEDHISEIEKMLRKPGTLKPAT
jgi:bacterioferritin